MLPTLIQHYNALVEYNYADNINKQIINYISFNTANGMDPSSAPLYGLIFSQKTLKHSR